MRISHFFLSLFAGFACMTQAFSIETLQNSAPEVENVLYEEESTPVNVELVAEDTAIQAGHPFWVAIHFLPEEGWHLYWKNPGDAGAPPVIDWKLPEGFTAGPLQWPAPHHFKVGDFSGLGYEEAFTLLAQITPPESISTNSVNLGAEVQWVACKDECIPGSPELTLSLPVSSGAPVKNSAAISLFSGAREHLPMKADNVTAAIENEFLTLHFSLPEGNGPAKSAEFYPEAEELVNLGKPQALENINGTYQLQVPLLKTLSAEDNPLSGVIVFSEEAGQTKAIEVKTNALAAIPEGKQDLSSSTFVKIESDQVKNLKDASKSAVVPEETTISATTILLAILAAFAGGLLLNLMPCVLPVLSLKVLSVVQAAGESRRERYKHGFAYVAGVLLSYWVLAGFLLALRASGEEIGWGFQLQEPIFVGILACLLFVMALNLFGVFEWGTSFAAIGSGTPKKKSGMLEALWSGVLATIVATPCTGPFLGASLGFAMALPPLGSFALFTVMGLGMALPFLLLTISPPLLKLLPKPGQWMVVLKQGMGFLLIASVLWLLWVWEAQTDFMAVMLMLGALFILSLGAWYYGNWGQMINSFKSRMIAMGVSAVTLTSALAIIISAAGEDVPVQAASTAQQQMAGLSVKPSLELGWENFTPERLQELRSKGTPVFIDFTAKWCLLCQANKVVMRSSSVTQAFNQAGVVRMRADWTKKDKEITRLLKQFQRSGVPLYVLYGPDGQSPIIFPETLTADMLIDAAYDAKRSQVANNVH